jgi:16S rRNA (cytosine1402-N4)-methyltransferase
MTVSPPDAPHKSVLLDEVVESLDLSAGRLVVDGTFGAGGYSKAPGRRGRCHRDRS